MGDPGTLLLTLPLFPALALSASSTPHPCPPLRAMTAQPERRLAKQLAIADVDASDVPPGGSRR